MALQEKLYELYLLDRQVRGLRSRLDFTTRRFDQQETKLKQLQRQKAELGDQLKHLQVKAADLENQIRSADERVEHLRQQMNTVTSNKEYSALLVEVNSLKEDRNKIEDQALQHMEEIERFKQQIQGIDTQIEQQSVLVCQAQKAVETCRGEVGTQLDSLTGDHARAMDQLPADIRSVFNRLQDTHDGEAMATVTEENRRLMEYACGGCFIAIPVERVNSLMVDHDQIVCCPNCGRILYIEQDLKASIGSK